MSQPTGGTSAIGDFPSYNYMSDVTERGEIFGLELTTYFGAFYNRSPLPATRGSSCRAATPRSADCRAILGATPPIMVFARAKNSS